MAKKITKDMTIGEIITINPNMAGVLMAGGIPFAPPAPSPQPIRGL